jgi:hypothetical protein
MRQPTTQRALLRCVSKTLKGLNCIADAGRLCQHKTPSTSIAVENLESGLANKTNEAVAEGHANTQGYVQQARELAGSALATAAVSSICSADRGCWRLMNFCFQTYLPTSITGVTSDGTPSTTASQTGTGVVSTLSSAAGTAVETAKSALNAASNAAAPHVETVRQAAQPHYENAIAAVQPHYETAKATVQPHVEKLAGVVGGTTTNATSDVTKPSDVPATTAPLESGNGHVGGPYTENAKSTVGSL